MHILDPTKSERSSFILSSPIYNSITIPSRLEELIKDLTKAVLRMQPSDIYLFAAEHFEEQVNGRKSIESGSCWNQLDSNAPRFKLFRTERPDDVIFDPMSNLTQTGNFTNFFSVLETRLSACSKDLQGVVDNARNIGKPSEETLMGPANEMTIDTVKDNGVNSDQAKSDKHLSPTRVAAKMNDSNCDQAATTPVQRIDSHVQVEEVKSAPNTNRHDSRKQTEDPTFSQTERNIRDIDAEEHQQPSTPVCFANDRESVEDIGRDSKLDGRTRSEQSESSVQADQDDQHAIERCADYERDATRNLETEESATASETSISGTKPSSNPGITKEEKSFPIENLIATDETVDANTSSEPTASTRDGPLAFNEAGRITTTRRDRSTLEDEVTDRIANDILYRILNHIFVDFLKLRHIKSDGGKSNDEQHELVRGPTLKPFDSKAESDDVRSNVFLPQEEDKDEYNTNADAVEYSKVPLPNDLKRRDHIKEEVTTKVALPVEGKNNTEFIEEIIIDCMCCGAPSKTSGALEMPCKFMKSEMSDLKPTVGVTQSADDDKKILCGLANRITSYESQDYEQETARISKTTQQSTQASVREQAAAGIGLQIDKDNIAKCKPNHDEEQNKSQEQNFASLADINEAERVTAENATVISHGPPGDEERNAEDKPNGKNDVDVHEQEPTTGQDWTREDWSETHSDACSCASTQTKNGKQREGDFQNESETYRSDGYSDGTFETGRKIDAEPSGKRCEFMRRSPSMSDAHNETDDDASAHSSTTSDSSDTFRSSVTMKIESEENLQVDLSIRNKIRIKIHEDKSSEGCAARHGCDRDETDGCCSSEPGEFVSKVAKTVEPEELSEENHQIASVVDSTDDDEDNSSLSVVEKCGERNRSLTIAREADVGKERDQNTAGKENAKSAEKKMESLGNAETDDEQSDEGQTPDCSTPDTFADNSNYEESSANKFQHKTTQVTFFSFSSEEEADSCQEQNITASQYPRVLSTLSVSDHHRNFISSTDFELFVVEEEDEIDDVETTNPTDFSTDTLVEKQRGGGDLFSNGSTVVSTTENRRTVTKCTDGFHCAAAPSCAHDTNILPVEKRSHQCKHETRKPSSNKVIQHHAADETEKYNLEILDHKATKSHVENAEDFLASVGNSCIVNATSDENLNEECPHAACRDKKLVGCKSQGAENSFGYSHRKEDSGTDQCSDENTATIGSTSNKSSKDLSMKMNDAKEATNEVENLIVVDWRSNGKKLDSSKMDQKLDAEKKQNVLQHSSWNSLSCAEENDKWTSSASSVFRKHSYDSLLNHENHSDSSLFRKRNSLNETNEFPPFGSNLENCRRFYLFESDEPVKNHKSDYRLPPKEIISDLRRLRNLDPNNRSKKTSPCKKNSGPRKMNCFTSCEESDSKFRIMHEMYQHQMSKNKIDEDRPKNATLNNDQGNKRNDPLLPRDAVKIENTSKVSKLVDYLGYNKMDATSSQNGQLSSACNSQRYARGTYDNEMNSTGKTNWKQENKIPTRKTLHGRKHKIKDAFPGCSKMERMTTDPMHHNKELDESLSDSISIEIAEIWNANDNSLREAIKCGSQDLSEKRKIKKHLEKLVTFYEYLNIQKKVKK